MDLIERTSIIGEIARRRQGVQLGKTAVMKLLHLLQEGLNVPLGYRFSLYNYGPYDTEVMSDIDFAESFGKISVSYQGPDHGYAIRPTAIGTEAPLAPATLQRIGQLMQDFGSLNARDLELRSTLLFLAQSYKDDELLIGRLRELKPKYSNSEARTALGDLRTKRFLQ